MKFKYIGRFMDVTGSLKAYAEKKINKLDWFFGDEADVQVKFALEKGERFIAEITIAQKGMLFRAEEISTDMYASIDTAVDKLSSQIRRHRTKLDKKYRSPAPNPVEQAPEAEFDEEKRIVRVKRFGVKPETIEDAITSMEQLGHSFYVFENAETGAVNVLYVRKDGDYGIIEPEK